MHIVNDIHSPEAQQLLAAPVFACDIETSTENVNWKPSHKRGLSYVADITEIGFYCGEDWAFILSATGTPAPYIVDEFDRQLDGSLVGVTNQYPATRYTFTKDENAFIRALFTAEDKTIIAHNAIFDFRQIFGKFDLAPVESCTYWDTKSTYGLRDKWRHAGSDDDGGDDEGDDLGSEDGAADLVSLYELYVEKLPDGYADFIAFMKKQRKNFPGIDFSKTPDIIINYIDTTPGLAEHADLLAQWQAFQEKRKGKRDDLVEELTTKYDLDRAALRKMNVKELRALYDEKEGQIDLSPLIAAMMGHYVTFDIVAPWKIAERQFETPADYKAYPKLLKEDLDYQKFCIDVARRGVRVDRQYAIKKLKALHLAYQKELEAMGYGADPGDWDRVLKRDFKVQYIFWGNRFDAEHKDSKTYPKDIKEAIAAAEEAGEQPTNVYPSEEVLSAYQFKLLTKKGQLKFSKGFPIKAADFSFGSKAMEVWFDIYSEMPELQNIGRLSKINGSIIFIESILRESAYDGRAHTNLGRFADTGRNTSTSPNLQNIHFGGDKAYDDPNLIDMAGILVSDDANSVLVELDYSNAENFSAAMISADNNMAYACCATDFHTARAMFFFGKDVMDGLTPEERKKKRGEAKTVGFGEGYGMGAPKLAITLGYTKDEAQALLDLSAKAFPALAEAKDNARAFADRNGWIPTWTGRRMRIPTQWWDGEKRFSGYTNGWNSPNQGGVAEIVVRAINRIRQWLMAEGYKTTVLSQVHDSLIINLYLDEYPHVPQKIIQIMGSILEGEVRYKAKGDEPAVMWNDSTSPSIRWLVDQDNIGNSTKWGFQDGREYPLPIEEYVNTWGLHTLTEDEMKAKKAPTWINSFGYGEDALKRELAGELGVELDLPEANPHKEAFQWAKLQHALNQMNAVVMPREINGRIFDWPTAMMVLQQQWERGESDEFKVIQEQILKLQMVMTEYEQWQAN